MKRIAWSLAFDGWIILGNENKSREIGLCSMGILFLFFEESEIRIAN